MTKLLLVLASISSISCVSIAGDRSPANQNSDFTPEYQRQLSSDKEKEKDSVEKWHEHQEYLRTIDRANRF